MAKKKESQSAEGTSRVLTMQFPYQAVSIAGDETVTLVENSGWNQVTITGPPNYCVVYSIRTWDLSGYTLQDMTLFPQGVLMQDLSVFPTGSDIENVQRATIVSTTPISGSDLSNVDPLGGWVMPGSMESTFKLDNIIQGRLQYFINTTTTANALQHTEKTWGSGDSTAGDKMWICEAYLFPLTGTIKSILIPESAVVMPSIIAKEPDLEYMMRLSRSLEPVY